MIAVASLNTCDCSHHHDQSARCADVAAAYDHGQAIIAADADLIDRAADLLAARRDLAFHADVLAGAQSWGIWHHVAKAVEAINDALGDLRCTVASEHQLWDGVDPADVPLVSVRDLIREFERGERA